MSFLNAYKIVVRNAAGTKVDEIDDFLSLSYTKRVNQPGVCEFMLWGNSSKISNFARKAQIEVHRSIGGAAFNPDFYGFFGGYKYANQRGVDYYTATCPGQMGMLGDRHILWHPATANRSQFSAVAGETIMKTLVNYNAGALATIVNGRVQRNGTITGLSVQADGAAGTAITVNVEWANLLKTLQDISPQVGGDFDLVKTGAATWEFRWYAPYLGTNRSTGSTAVLFSLERENMENPVLTVDRNNERTVAVIGGAGQDAATRIFNSTTGTDYDVNLANSELFINASNISLAGSLLWRGVAELNKLRARPKLTFNPLQTANTTYGVHYFLGDVVKAAYRGFSAVQKIVGITVTYTRNEGERIRLELQDL